MSTLTPAGSTRAWRRIRLHVLDRDRWRCLVPDAAGIPCGRPLRGPLYPSSTWTPHVDHKTRRRHGGTDDPDNLRAACWPCNRARELAGAGDDLAAGLTPPPAEWSW